MGTVPTCGEVQEWLNWHAWNACVGLHSPRVRIPVSLPQGNFFGFGRPHGRLFLWLRGAQTKGFSEGEKFLGQPLAAPFWILEIGSIRRFVTELPF